MDPAPDPLAISASAPFPTIPAPSSPRPRPARPRRQARSDHLASAAASAASRRSGIDLSHRPAASSFALQEGSPSLGSWGASRDANFVFGSGAAGAPEMRRSFSSGSGEASLTESSAVLGKLALDASPGGEDSSIPARNTDDRFGDRGSNSTLHEGFCPDSLHNPTEQINEGIGVPSETIQCENVEIRSSASPTCTDENAPVEFARSGDSLPTRNSADEGCLPVEGSKNSAHGGSAHRSFIVFGGRAGYQSFAANATQTNVSKVDSADKDSVPYDSEQLYSSVAKDTTGTKLILQDANHAFGSSNNDLPRSEPHETTSMETVETVPNFGSEVASVKGSSIKAPYDIEAVATSEHSEYEPFDDKSFSFEDHNVAYRNKGGTKGLSMNRRAVMPNKSSGHQVSSMELVSRRSVHCSGKVPPEKMLNLKEGSSLVLEDSDINCAQADSNTSVLQTTETRSDETKFTSAANMGYSDQSDFIFSASSFDQSMLHSQRWHNKKKGGGMGNHASSIQSIPSSAIGLSRSEVSGSQRCVDLAAQWTEYSKIEPERVTVSRGAECSKIEVFGHHDNCEIWRLRGNQAYAEGRLTEAEECYTHGIDSHSANEASRKALMLCYSNRAATRMSLGKMREALSDCREATGIDSSFLKAQVRAANCLLSLGDVEEAWKAFEMCLKSNHLSSLDNKIVEEASDGLQKAQKISGFILQSKEYLITKAFDKIPSALQMISNALSISIYSDNLMAMKAEALLLLQQYEEVIRFCEETLSVAERNSVCLCHGEHSENNNFNNNTCSVKLWRYHLIAKSYFFLGKLEEAHQFLKKYEQINVMGCRCGKQSQESISSFSRAISELLRLKAAGNEAFQSGKYLKAVEHYTNALLSNSESLRFLAVCFCNRAAAYQASGQILDAIVDCSLAIALDSDYAKAISRRSSLYELIRDYGQAANDLRRLIALLEKQLQENMSMPLEKTESIRSNLNRANLRFSSLERDARKGASLNMYLIFLITWLVQLKNGGKEFRSYLWLQTGQLRVARPASVRAVSMLTGAYGGPHLAARFHGS
ncbi:hypothetical protein BS78_03G115900 [Paspalum vaginatum]|nr:hypothetical protein BS78_03G115900 [Paspalum vaginatum]